MDELNYFRKRYISPMYVDRNSWQYKVITPYIDRILRGESLTVEQIYEALSKELAKQGKKISKNGILNTYSHYLKYWNQ